MDSRSRSSGGRLRTLPAGSGHGDESFDVRTGSRPKLASTNDVVPPPEAPRIEGSQRVRSLPPFDPTVARPSRKPLPKVALPTPRPILASECLRDDAAPIEPHARGTRFWTLGLGLGVVACAALMLARDWPLAADAASMRAIATTAAMGVTVVAFALSLRRYALRGALVLSAALVGASALLVLQQGGGVAVARFVAAMPLAAASFLRVSYRSDRTVRALLGVSIVTFLLAACFVGGAPVFQGGASLVARSLAGAMALVAGLSLLGFMGEETTAGCTVWGTLAALFGGGSLALDAFVRPGAPGWPASAAAALALPIAAIGMFQILATIVGPRLRVTTTSRSSLPAAPPEVHDADEAMLPSDD